MARNERWQLVLSLMEKLARDLLWLMFTLQTTSLPNLFRKHQIVGSWRNVGSITRRIE